MRAVSSLAVLAQSTAGEVDEPVGLLVIIAVLLAVLGVLVAALTVLYVRATRPRRSPEAVVASSDRPDPTAGRPAPVSDAAATPPAPARRRSPVLRTRTSLWRR